MTEGENDSAIPADSGAGRLDAIGALRLAVGLAQGVLLYFLFEALNAKTWPAIEPLWFAPLLAAALFIPVFFSQSLGTMQARSLGIWISVATTTIAALAWYDRYQSALVLGNDRNAAVPSFGVLFFGFGGLFIAQALTASGDTDKSFVTRYRTYFDETWKFGVQLALSAAFVGAFWALLWLGSVLFGLIHLDFLSKLIDREWFSIPATALAVAAALHLTDIRARLIAGIRTVALTLLSWLLPLITLLVLGFVASLTVTGLSPLWDTRMAARLLLTAAGALVLLINATYQDGEGQGHPILRYTELIASALLVPLVALSAYALALRVQQYGWTVERIATLACVLVAACYAFGYTAAALFSLLGGQWMWALESVNIFVAFLILAVLLALFSPVADPARLSVLSQVSRLQAGSIAPDKFDFLYLHREGGRYGEAALEQLARNASGADSEAVRLNASLALKGELPHEVLRDIAKRVTFYPKSATLPASFAKQDWSGGGAVPPCLTSNASCDAYFLDIDHDGTPEVVLVADDPGAWSGIYKQNKTGTWDEIGDFTLPKCTAARAAMHAGRLATMPPAPSIPDLDAGGQRIVVLPPAGPAFTHCPD